MTFWEKIGLLAAAALAIAAFVVWRRGAPTLIAGRQPPAPDIGGAAYVCGSRMEGCRALP